MIEYILTSLHPARANVTTADPRRVVKRQPANPQRALSPFPTPLEIRFRSTVSQSLFVSRIGLRFGAASSASLNASATGIGT